jgi:hypothetical protein
VFVAVVAAAIALTPSSRLALAATPSGAPAMAHGMVMPAMQDMARDMAMPGDEAVEAAADMPCCPQQAPSPVDCDKCVVMAGCMAQCFSGVVATAADLLPRLAASIVPQHETVRPTSQGRPPPEYPPRSLV